MDTKLINDLEKEVKAAQDRLDSVRKQLEEAKNLPRFNFYKGGIIVNLDSKALRVFSKDMEEGIFVDYTRAEHSCYTKTEMLSNNSKRFKQLTDEQVQRLVDFAVNLAKE